MISISIIIPVYGTEVYVEGCVRSVIAQEIDDTADLECVIVDDGSMDGSMERVRRALSCYDGKIKFKLIKHPANLGLSEARNTGVRAATGDYILFLDSDDELTDGAMHRFVEKVLEYPDVDMVVGDYLSDKEYAEFHIKAHAEYIEGNDKCKAVFLKEKMFPDTAHNKLVKRRFVTDNQLYFRSGIYHEDNLWKWHCAKHIESVAFVKYPTMTYFMHPGSIMNQGQTALVESLLKIVEEKIATLDDCRRKAQLCNITLLLHQLDERTRKGDSPVDYPTVRNRIKELAETLKVENGKTKSFRTGLSLWLLKLKLSRKDNRPDRLFCVMQAIARRLVN